jgi:hypothetical protein
MPGARCTHGFVQRKHEVVHRFTGTFRHSLRNGFTVSFVLSPVIGLSCHRRPPRRLLLKDLTPASRRQDHTTSPYECRAVRPRAASRPSLPAPHVRDDRDTPLLRARDSAIEPVICLCDQLQ